MDQIDTSSLSFILPVRIDGPDRIENLTVCVKFLRKHFPDSEIQLIENDSKKTLTELSSQYKLTYLFIENKGRFSKTQTINHGLLKSTRKYIVIYDVDVLIDPAGIYKGLKIMNKGIVKVLIPHNTIFVNAKGTLKQKLIETLDYSLVPHYKSLGSAHNKDECELYIIPSGVVIIDREMMINEGGYNQKMVSYGWEDIEVLKRFKKMGYYYYCLLQYNLIHLDHHRGEDSKENEFFSKNEDEFRKVLAMSRKQLTRYIDTDLVIKPDIEQADKGRYRKKQKLKNLLHLQFCSYWISRIKLNLSIKGLDIIRKRLK